MKLFISLNCNELNDAQIAPAQDKQEEVGLFLWKVVFPMNVKVLLKVVIPQPNSHKVLNNSHAHLFLMNWLFPARVMLVLYIARAMPMLSWKEQLTSLTDSENCKIRAVLLAEWLQDQL